MSLDSPNGNLSLDLESLVSPYGVVSGVSEVIGLRGLDRVSTYCASVGSAWPGLMEPDDTYGCGRAIDDEELARFVAIAEGAERSAGFLTFESRTARLRELPGPAIDMTAVPRCSAREYADPACPLRPYDADLPIRWVRGLELVSMEQRWIPAVMAHYGARHELAGEAFWNGISTGYAVHSDLVEATVRGICEVIERDMVALTWHQMLRLPRLQLTALSEEMGHLLAWSDDHFIETYLMDARSDVGVPAVYCMQRAPHDVRAQHVVAAATGRTMSEAAFKAMLETLLVRSLCYSESKPVKDPGAARFGADVEDGMRYMGVPERAAAFDFLTEDWERRRTVHDHEVTPLPQDPAQALSVLVARLAGKDMEVVVVDSTPVELANVGLCAVSAVIPALQPLSLIPRAAYLGHRRLYEAPAAMGHPCHPEADLNPWPQPFA